MTTAAVESHGGETRTHGSRACYVWGPGPGPGAGCRCAACTEANRADHQRRERLRLYGQWQPFVDAAPVREHLETLRHAGIGWRRAAALAGVSTATISRILYGRAGRPPTRGVRRETAAAILTVRPGIGALAPSALVDATGTRRRLQALVATGWTQAQIAARLGMLGGNFGQLLRRQQVTVATARAVSGLYDELWNQPPPESAHREKIAASRARNYAAARDWPPPLGWDDDSSDGHGIDDPDATPAPGWKRSERRTQRSAQVVPDALWLMAQGFTREQAAQRLGLSRAGLEKAFARQRQAHTQTSTQEGLTMAPTHHQQQSIPCKCGAVSGERCTPQGDHLGRYMDAEKAGKIGRPELARAVEGLDIIAPAAIVPSRQAELEREAG